MPNLIAAQHVQPHPAWPWVRVATCAAWSAHLLLSDAASPDWRLPNTAALIALPLLLSGRAQPLAWSLLSAAALAPLLLAGDVLTQSTLLDLWAASAAIAWALGRPDDALTAWRLSTAATYALATLHKLNAAWIDPRTSCALYGWREVRDYLRLPDLTPPGLPIAVLLTEATIAALLLSGRHRAAWPLACAFHLTMTWTLAPAFALVMLAGHSAALTAHDLDQLRARWAAHKARIIAGALAATALTCLLHGGPPEDLTMLPREALLWGLLWLTLPDASLTRQPQPVARWAAALALLFALRAAASPYLGLEVQHSAAMLSNLRIDQGCWNHLLIPEAVRWRDDLIRIKRASLGAPERHPKQRDALTGELWDLPRLRTAARNWCKADSARPLRIEGHHQRAPFTIDDLCAPGALDPLAATGGMFGGPERLPRYLRFQKNLSRACPTVCVH
jgi:hypothetical protein